MPTYSSLCCSCNSWAAIDAAEPSSTYDRQWGEAVEFKSCDVLLKLNILWVTVTPQCSRCRVGHTVHKCKILRTVYDRALHGRLWAMGVPARFESYYVLPELVVLRAAIASQRFSCRVGHSLQRSHHSLVLS